MHGLMLARSLSITLLALGLTAFLGAGCSSGDSPTPETANPGTPPSTTAPAPGANAGAGAGGATTTTPTNGTSDLFHMTFGDPKNRAVVFVHGGPGSNSVMFEASGVAAALAQQGNFVVTYDQRGSGRSPRGVASDYAFAKSTQDLDDLIHSLNLKSPILLAHSFGGTLALQYMERHPGVVKGALTVANPIDFPDTYFNVHELCVSFFKKRLKVLDLQAVNDLHAAMFPNGKQPPYAFTGDQITKTMQVANSCMLYLPTFPTVAAAKTWASLELGPNKDLLTAVEPSVGDGFQTNEKVGYVEFSQLLAKHASRVWGIYGDQDGLVSPGQRAKITSTITPSHTTVVEAAGHFLFVDQEEQFLSTAQKYLDAISALPN